MSSSATRAPVACIDAGVQAHAAFPAPDQTYVVVANQNGKLLQRIRTNFATNSFTLENAATIDLAACTTPSGAACQEPTLRPDNAPVCPVVDSTSRLTFVTLRGGGLFVVDSTATPMAIVAEYDRATIHPAGCGGVEANGKMYINAGVGPRPYPIESHLYNFTLSDFSTLRHPLPRVPGPNTPAPRVVFDQDDLGFTDSHGMVLTNDGLLWVADRAGNRITIVNTRTDRVVDDVVDGIALPGPVSEDPTPDLLDISPSGDLVFATLRGPNPLTGNEPSVNNAVGGTPGLGIIRVEHNGRSGVLQAIAPISHIVGGVERADPHGLAVRRTTPTMPGLPATGAGGQSKQWATEMTLALLGIGGGLLVGAWCLWQRRSVRPR
jgi:hypothetical protein